MRKIHDQPQFSGMLCLGMTPNLLMWASGMSALQKGPIAQCLAISVL